MVVKFSRYDTADYLKTDEDIAAYLDAVMEDGDPALIAAALGDVARARNFSQLARDVGMSRQGLDKALSSDGNPTLETIAKIAQALGFRLSVKEAVSKSTVATRRNYYHASTPKSRSVEGDILMAKSGGTKSSGGGKSGGHNRSAITGKYVTPSYAKSHPKTTVKESPSRPSGKK